MGYVKQVQLQVEEWQSTVGLVSAGLTEVEVSLDKGLTAMREAIALWAAMEHQQEALEALELEIPTELGEEAKAVRQQLHRVESRLLELDRLMPSSEPAVNHRQGTGEENGALVGAAARLNETAESLAEAIADPLDTPALAGRYLVGALPFLFMLAFVGLSVRLVILYPHWFYR